MRTEVPQVLQFDRLQSSQYRARLGPDLRFQFADHEYQYGHPIIISPAAAQELKQAADTTHRIITQGVQASGSTTSWVSGREPTLGWVKLNNPKVNQQLEYRLKQGYKLPLVYDVILTSNRGVPSWRVVEMQSAIGYSAWHMRLLQAAGFNPDDPGCYIGPQNPKNVLDNIKKNLTRGEEVVVMDTNPFGGTMPEQVGMAKMLGSSSSMPISVLDVHQDGEGYFYHPYVVDNVTGYPMKDSSGGEGYLRECRKVRIKDVFARMTQSDLDALNLKLLDSRQRELIINFLNDPDINWLWHPTWQYVADKTTLPLARRRLSELGSVYADHFVPIFKKGEEVIPGTYIKKPTNAVSGAGQSVVVVDANTPKVVEEGYVYQQRFTPYPVNVTLPDHLTGAFPPPDDIPHHIVEHFGWNRANTPGTLEIRFMPMPYSYDQLSAWVMARFAPRWSGQTDFRDFTKTNQRMIMDALWLSQKVNNQNHFEYPFGWCPVVVR